jgi:hypothetical protein
VFGLQFNFASPRLGVFALKIRVQNDLREIENAASQITLQGARYSEQHQKLVGR